MDYGSIFRHWRGFNLSIVQTKRQTYYFCPEKRRTRKGKRKLRRRPRNTTYKFYPWIFHMANTLQSTVGDAIRLFGHVDILVNNGGLGQRSLIQETSLEVDRQLMEVNYFGTIALTKYLLPHFINRKQGHVVTITSLTGKFGTPYRSAYAASKHALHGFFDALRAEHWKDKILVTMICPGFIKTNLSVAALTGSGVPQNKLDKTSYD